MSDSKKSFYEFKSSIIEPWDGPAAIIYTNGKSIGSILDRNGLRPARYQIDKSNNITIASETGVNPISNDQIVEKGRVSPGGIFAINTFTGEILNQNQIDNDLKSIFTEICKKTLTGDPDKVYLDGIKEIQKIIKT